ncbi:MAG: hypothetical protein C4554_03220 [Dethiobacter sp.]|jgi:hypothetical protein|nr:MAG: hypothetical protein C4554_03220 [Dethiobacter sp.]
MPAVNKITVTRKLDSYLEAKKDLNSIALLLQAVRKALEDIKNEEPCVAGLNITELSFLRDAAGNLKLKVYFE